MFREQKLLCVSAGSCSWKSLLKFMQQPQLLLCWRTPEKLSMMSIVRQTGISINMLFHFGSPSLMPDSAIHLGFEVLPGKRVHSAKRRTPGSDVQQLFQRKFDLCKNISHSFPEELTGIHMNLHNPSVR